MKKRGFFITVFAVLLILFAALPFLLSYEAENASPEKRTEAIQEEEKVSEKEPSNLSGEQEPIRDEGLLEITIFDVGQGDAALVRQGEHCILIDAGPDAAGTFIRKQLLDRGIRTLDYVVATHPDADHIGGMDVILYKFGCKTLFMTGRKNDTAACRNVLQTIRERGLKPQVPAKGQQFPLGEAMITVLSDALQGMNEEEVNNSSICLRIDYGENAVFFGGDAEAAEEQALLESGLPLYCSVLKVSHHGSNSSSCDEFLDAVNPRIALISCGADNEYGHPHREVLERLADRNIEYHITAEEGSVTLLADAVGGLRIVNEDSAEEMK